MRPFSAYVQPAGSTDEYELEIRHSEQRFLIRHRGSVIDDWRAAPGPLLSVQQLLDIARAAVPAGRGRSSDADD